MGRRSRLSHPDRTIQTAAYYSQPTDDVLDGRAHLAPASRCTSEEFEKKWVEFCDFIHQDSEQYLRSGTFGTYMRFMEWLLDGSGIRRLDVAMARFGRLQMLYRYKIGSSMDQAIVDRARAYIQTTLKTKFELIAGKGAKPVMEIEDLAAVFEYLWCYDTHRYHLERKRVQLACFILIAAFTSSRPGAIIVSSASGIRGTGAALSYKDIQLIKMRNPGLGREFIMAVRITMSLMKGRRDKNTPEVYVLHEYDGCFAMCPIIHIIALALADKAFKENYSTVDAVYRAEIPVGVKQISLKWKTDVMDLALFRSVAKGQPTSEALSYHSLATNWRKLVSDAGFEAPPSFYAIRRGTANVLNNLAPQSILMQAMGHKSPSEFRKSYQSQAVRFDIQSAVLGVPLQTSTVIAAGNELRFRDARAPKELSEEQQKLLWNDAKLTELRNKMLELGDECERRYGSREEARKQDGPLAKKFKEAENIYRNERRYERTSMLKSARANFFESVHDSVPTVPTIPQHVIPERSRLASTLFIPVTDAEEAHTVRVSAISDMYHLCFREEARGKIKSSKTVRRLQSDLQLGRVSLRCAPKTCLFCLGRYKDKTLSTRSRLCRHLEKMHYPNLPRKPFECPHPECGEMLKHISHFQLHSMQVHKIEYTKKSGQVMQKEWAKQVRHLDGK